MNIGLPFPAAELPAGAGEKHPWPSPAGQTSCVGWGPGTVLQSSPCEVVSATSLRNTGQEVSAGLQ